MKFNSKLPLIVYSILCELFNCVYFTISGCKFDEKLTFLYFITYQIGGLLAKLPNNYDKILIR